MKGHENDMKQCKNDAKRCKMTRNNAKTTQRTLPKIKDFDIKFESFIDEFYKYDTFYSKLLFITYEHHSKQLFMFLYFGGW